MIRQNTAAAGASLLTELYAPIEAEMRAVEGVIEDELFSKHTFVRDLCSQVGGYRGKMLRPARMMRSLLRPVMNNSPATM